MQRIIESQLRAGQPLAAAILVERCRLALEEVGTTPSPAFERRFGNLRRPRDDSQSELRLPFVARERELPISLRALRRMCARGGKRHPRARRRRNREVDVAGARRVAALPSTLPGSSKSAAIGIATTSLTDACVKPSPAATNLSSSSSTTRKTSQRMRCRSSRFSLKRGERAALLRRSYAPRSHGDYSAVSGAQHSVRSPTRFLEPRRRRASLASGDGIGPLRGVRQAFRAHPGHPLYVVRSAGGFGRKRRVGAPAAIVEALRKNSTNRFRSPAAFASSLRRGCSRAVKSPLAVAGALGDRTVRDGRRPWLRAGTRRGGAAWTPWTTSSHLD